MAKKVTTWTNNNVKKASSWVAPTKNSSAWANNITKKATSYTTTGKNSTGWNPGIPVQTSYKYDDPGITYDSAAVGYDWLNPATNTLNTKKPTTWVVS